MITARGWLIRSRLRRKEIKELSNRSKVFVTREGKTIQINYLKEGKKAVVERIIGGTHLKEKFELLSHTENPSRNCSK